MLSKKHYTAIADILRTHDKALAASEQSIMTDLVIDLASYFKRDNPNFDTGKFLLASLELTAPKGGEVSVK